MGTALKRSPLKRSSAPLKHGGDALGRSEIKPRSDSRQDFMKNERIPLIKAMISSGRKCEISPLLVSAGVDEARWCRGKIEGLHELRKRSSGGSLSNTDNLIPACNLCNGLVESFPKEAHSVGLVVRPGDPNYDCLGAKHDQLRDDLQEQDAE